MLELTEVVPLSKSRRMTTSAHLFNRYYTAREPQRNLVLFSQPLLWQRSRLSFPTPLDSIWSVGTSVTHLLTYA